MSLRQRRVEEFGAGLEHAEGHGDDHRVGCVPPARGLDRHLVGAADHDDRLAQPDVETVGQVLDELPVPARQDDVVPCELRALVPLLGVELVEGGGELVLHDPAQFEVRHGTQGRVELVERFGDRVGERRAVRLGIERLGHELLQLRGRSGLEGGSAGVEREGDVVGRHVEAGPRRGRGPSSGSPSGPWIQEAPRSTGNPRSSTVHTRPPMRSRASMTVTSSPASCRARAAPSPANPAPTTRTRRARPASSTASAAARPEADAPWVIDGLSTLTCSPASQRPGSTGSARVARSAGVAPGGR